MLKNILEETFAQINGLSQSEREEMPHVNCCEHILLAGDKHMDLNLSQDVLKTVRGFGGGMKIGHLCGALSGCVMILSHYYEDQTIREYKIESFFDAFQSQYDSLMCDALKDKYREEDTGCQRVILMAAEVLEKIICSEMRS